MLAFRLQVIIIVAMLLVALMIVNLLRQKKIDFKYGLGWLVIDLCILCLAVFPFLLEKIAHFIGIASPVNMLFFFGLLFSLVVIFSLSVAVSKLSDRVKKLSQEIAIIRKDMYDNINKVRQEKNE